MAASSPPLELQAVILTERQEINGSRWELPAPASMGNPQIEPPLSTHSAQALCLARAHAHSHTPTHIHMHTQTQPPTHWF